MEREECLSILADVLQQFSPSGSADQAEDCLSRLGYVVTLTANVESTRDFLGLSVSIWSKLSEAIGAFVDNLAPDLKEDALSILRVRIVRGVVLTARNLVVGVKNALKSEDKHKTTNGFNLNTRELYSLIIQNQKHVNALAMFSLDNLEHAKLQGPEDLKIPIVELYMKTIAACFQYLTNLSTADIEDIHDVAHHLDLKGVSPLLHRVVMFDGDMGKMPANSHINVFGSSEVIIPFSIYVNNISNNPCIIQELFDNPMAAGLLKHFIDKYDVSDRQTLEAFSEVDYLNMSISFKVVTHEGFLAFSKQLVQQNDEEAHQVMFQLLKLVQLLTASKEWDWDSNKLTIVITWLLEIYRSLSREATPLLSAEGLTVAEKETLSKNQKSLLCALDTIGSLCQYDHVRNYLNSYKFLEELIAFLHIVHNNTERKTLKSSTDSVSAGKKEYPMIKSVIIEIITFLIYQNFENQELVRNLHALEVVLSNCNLDKNEPFVKERAILCIKYLLENNPGNQEFVRKMEAQRTVIDKEDEAILERTGFEVDIVDGNVRLKRSDKLQELERKN
ncbi:unnamed protein product [Kuraishia capsulata CBS 1993]|uniref:Ataxin-10 homolog n=1 Tax=Kuraishia capsulata CBS 1993 TaxID=1382522 RepID=W6MN89_9ASCO|nr:uncharacterized protein KUCA_T00003712001 [Kuraishia capsulata CBS 1993]CDK27733.1 unnamed protein product [Kuraishia capsulata CBS 1993]